jgi:peptidoglycan/xylan/chitin deacetylase (PgdA/CDA1 family)
MGAKARIWFNRALMIGLSLAGVVIVFFLPVPWALKIAAYAIAIAIGGTVAFRTIPAFDPLGRVKWRLPSSSEKRCAITFDDGPSADTDKVLEILEKHDVKATFFILAGNARRHKAVMKRLVEHGHTIAVHGTTHRKLHEATDDVIEKELTTAAAQLEELGAKPARLYRTPHGLKNAAVFRVAKRTGYELWAWSRGIWDTDRPAPEVLVDRATRFARSGMVLLLHDGRGDEETPDIGPMVAALPDILVRLRDAGFRFVTLDRV